MMRFPPELTAFVNGVTWTFARTYAATWPHEYIVRSRVDEDLFVLLVRHIRTHGHVGMFYDRPFTYFEDAGLVYWTMGEPVEETDIVNRCTKEQTYEYRLRHGTLPESTGAGGGDSGPEGDAARGGECGPGGPSRNPARPTRDPHRGVP